MSAAVELRGVTKRFGDVTAVEDVSLRVEAGEFLTLLGPSGCGKTTLLRLIAGFEAPTAGTVWVGGQDVTLRPPQQRPVNQVFQSYALFPHLTVAENIGFGLRMERMPAKEAAERVREALALVSLDGLETRRPHELSGGQRQRVALARALAPRPLVLLLDEPLSALDARLRQAMQVELKRLQRQLGTTFVLVTHDQEEALTMSDRIALIQRGRIEQLGEVHEIYHRPVSAFAAEFLGNANLLEAALVAREPAGVRIRVEGGLEWVLPPDAWPAGAARAKVSIRPEKVHLSKQRLSGANTFEACVEDEVFRGETDHFVLVTTAGTRIGAVVANESAIRESIHAGERVWCAVHPADVVVITAPTPT